jgi:hypothetical protein
VNTRVSNSTKDPETLTVLLLAPPLEECLDVRLLIRWFGRESLSLLPEFLSPSLRFVEVFSLLLEAFPLLFEGVFVRIECHRVHLSGEWVFVGATACCANSGITPDAD